MSNKINVLHTLDNFVKQATTEAGGFEGDTQHPSKDVDDRTQVAQEGSRSKENTEGIKDEQGKASVDATPVAKAANLLKKFNKRAEGTTPAAVTGSAESDQLQIGTKKAPTGEDPANETSSVKGGKDDPGSTHPARTDNDQLDGHKYACDADTPLSKIAQMVGEISKSICNDVISLSDLKEKRAMSNHQQQNPNNQWPEDRSLNFQTGQELSDLLTGKMDKQAADHLVSRTAEDIIRRALQDGENVFVYMRKTAEAYEAKAKKANDPSLGGAPGGGMPMGGDMGGMGGGGSPGGGMNVDPAILSAMSGAGGGAGGEGGGGGMPPPMEGGGEGGGGGLAGLGEEELLALLEQAGISEEDLIAAAQSGGGGGAGGSPPMGGGGEPPPPSSTESGGVPSPEEKTGSAKQTKQAGAGDITKFFAELRKNRRHSA